MMMASLHLLKHNYRCSAEQAGVPLADECRHLAVIHSFEKNCPKTVQIRQHVSSHPITYPISWKYAPTTNA